MWLGFLPIVFAGAGLYAASRLVKGDLRRIPLLAVIFAAVYGWLATVAALNPMDSSIYMAHAIPAFFVAMIALFLLERKEESLAPWLMIYAATILVFIIFI